MEILDWKFIFVIITFALIGIGCLIKRSRIGVTAASFGVVSTLVIWGIVRLNIKFQSFLSQVGLTFKDILTFVAIILVAIIAFIVIFFVLKTFNSLNGKVKKR
ncbi:hypothetical protein [Clostridium sp. B9]|uniref:hypothetical protein n=1 Tax=Clostridium sp. B9 TaxID=3423224 RepID=UPI003D2EF71A